MAVPTSELQKINPSSIIELFELELNVAQHGTSEIFRFHAGTNERNNGSVWWAGNEYLAFPIEAGGFDYSGTGQLPRPTIRVSNILNTITALILSLPDGLEGAKVTRIRTLARYIDARNFTPLDGYNLITQSGDFLIAQDLSYLTTQDIQDNPYGTPDPTAEFPREIYVVDRKTAENRDIAEFELAAAFDLAGVRAPKRQCIANICQWVYKSTECSYTGDLPSCLKTLTDCKAHFGSTAELPFGSFPGIGAYYG